MHSVKDNFENILAQLHLFFYVWNIFLHLTTCYGDCEDVTNYRCTSIVNIVFK